MLYIVSTPIGNLEDISLRAIRVLNEVDFIACEDTRHSGKLVESLNKGQGERDKEKGSRFISFHSHSWEMKLDKILNLLKEWKSVALVSDAGTPWISDPAYLLTKEARALWIKIVPIPWAAAFLAALQASWVAINKFQYLGFVPTKKWRETFFKNLKDAEMTIVFYESVHRIQKCLEQICEFIWEDRRVIVARELTKIYEEFFDGTAKDALNHFKNPKGEFVVILPI